MKSHLYYSRKCLEISFILHTVGNLIYTTVANRLSGNVMEVLLHKMSKKC